MMREIIERFRYRFDLWHRERREDLFGMPRSDSRTLREYEAERTPSRWHPKYNKALLAESSVRFVVRGVVVYFGIIIIAAQISRMVVGLLPATRYPLDIIFVVFVCVWTLVMIIGTFDVVKARRQHSVDTKSSNQSMQPTASPRTASLSDD